MASEALVTSNMLFGIIESCTRLLHQALKYCMNSHSVNYNILSLTWHPLLVLLNCTPTTSNLLFHQGLQVSAEILYGFLLYPAQKSWNNISAPILLPNWPSTSKSCIHLALTICLRHWGAKGHWRRVTLTCMVLLQQGYGRDPQMGPRCQIDNLHAALHLTQRLCQTSIMLGHVYPYGRWSSLLIGR